MEPQTLIKKIAFISTFPPRHSGIATFTSDLISDFAKNYPQISTVVIAVNDCIDKYLYGDIVQYEINENKLSTYLQAADYININEFDIVCIQHEFECFDKFNTSNLMLFLEHIKTPTVITLHTTISNPNELQRRQIERLRLLTTRFVVLTQGAVEIVETKYFIPPRDVEIIAPGMGAARKYLHSFEKAREIFGGHILNNNDNCKTDIITGCLPPLKFNHLIRITDSIGVFQHAKYSFPDYSEGYCTDDNARALILTLLASQLNGNDSWLDNLKSQTISFLNFALDRRSLRFRNFMGFNREWLDKQGSEDSHGRAMWALGYCINKSYDNDLQDMANQMFKAALTPVTQFSNPRSWSFVLLGVNEYLKRFPDDRICKNIEFELSNRIFKMFSDNMSSDWPWCEDIVTYDNARITQGLLNCGSRTGRADFIDTALHSLRWLIRIQTTDNGRFRAIGSNGFYKRGSSIAQFDQQPIEASAMISSCCDAFKITGDFTWVQSARTIFSWFVGVNDLGISLYDETSGGCRDALHADRVNRNQGAESTISFLTSLTEMYLLQKHIQFDKLR